VDNFGCSGIIGIGVISEQVMSFKYKITIIDKKK
jgi:hypothetical protein